MRSARGRSGYEVDTLDRLAFLLPAPLRPADLSSEAATPGATVVWDSWAVEGDAAALPFMHRFSAVPRFGVGPRALIPDHAGPEVREVLVPRATSRSRVGRVASTTLRRTPLTLVRGMGRRLTIGTESPSDAVQFLREAVNDAVFACGLRPGAPLGKAVVHVFGGGRLRGVAKFVSGGPADRLSNEALVLEELAHVPGLASRVPTLLGRPPFHLGSSILMTPVAGLPNRLPRAAVQEFLDACVLGPSVTAIDTELVLRVAQSAMRFAELRPVLEEALDDLSSSRVPSTVVHGDFVPWNLRFHAGVVSAFDWEYGVSGGVPEWDSLYFDTQVGVVKGQWGSAELAETTRRRLEQGSPHYNREGLRGLVKLLLVDLAARYLEKGMTARATTFTGAFETVL